MEMDPPLFYHHGKATNVWSRIEAAICFRLRSRVFFQRWITLTWWSSRCYYDYSGCRCLTDLSTKELSIFPQFRVFVRITTLGRFEEEGHPKEFSNNNAGETVLRVGG